MKLNYKRTILVGFAFFLICAFWQAYDNTVPLILTNKFGMSQTWSGVIMALDNVLALFLLPLFGHISDKFTHPRGRRTPFIVVGTLIAAVALIALSFADNAQLKRLDKVSAIDDPAALTVIYNEQKDATLLSPSGESFILGHKFTEAEFTAIRSQTVTPEGKTVTDPAYTNYVVPARQACARDAAAANPGALVVFVGLLLIILLSMATFRSPAVALMPDVTPKPIRSRANAIINLMGAVGGISYLIVAAVLYPNSKTAGAAHVNYQPLFVVVSVLMAVSVIVLYFTTNEPKLAAAEKEYEAEHPEQQLVEALGEGQLTLIEGTQETLFREYSLSLFGQSIPFMATIDLGCLLDFSADVDGTCEQWLETIEGSLGEASQTQQDDATQYLWPCEGGGLALVSSQDALTLRFYREQPAA